ncbi:MAG: HAL/PAL/TAL family ammonia-lyase [Halofilum sp. (in: g-proteobacteria)]
MQQTPQVVFDGTPLSAADIAALADRRRRSVLSDESAFVEWIDRGAEFIDRVWQEEGVVYGVTTGYGDSCSVSIPPELVEELPQHLYTFHGCGLGAIFDEPETRAILAARLASLAQGFSGVRYTLLAAIHRLIEADILPVIPREGSVGASGDLTPLSYVAAVLAGEREVIHAGRRRPTAEVFDEHGIEPIVLRPKETLAIMNGTAVMTALACLALERARYLCRLASRITSLAVLALQGNANHFDPRLFSTKPHPGQGEVARRIHDDLGGGDHRRQSSRLQDRYSLRCAPHVVGVLEDSLPWLTQFIETELNSANDNPIIDPGQERVLHGGHFYGGHITFAMDSLKTAVANVADLLDRQLAQLVDPKFNHGLPANLSGAQGARRPLNHGFKAVQIGTSAWAAEALKLTMPASVFSRSTESHNQDKVSMGTIGARDCLRVLTLTEQVAAATLIGASQGIWLRERAEEIDVTAAGRVRTTLEEVAAVFPMLVEDRPLEATLRDVLGRIGQREFTLYE